MMSALAGMLQNLKGGATNPGAIQLPANKDQAMAAATDMLKAFTGASNNPMAALGGKPGVDFRELKALLPGEVAGLRRTNAQGKKTSAFGAEVTEARGEYGEAAGPHMNIKITDLAAMGPFGALAGMTWMVAEVESEDDDGYEKTTSYAGFKGLEKYTKSSKSGSAKVVVGNRFIVEIDGRGVEPVSLKAAAESIDLKALDALAKSPQVK